MTQISISFIQSDLHWQQPGANLAMFEEKIWELEKTDIIVLPEMFNTGFSMNVESIAEPMNFTTFKWMKQQAMQTKACIVGSVAVKDGREYFNRLIWMFPDGSFQQYDKRHLFRMMDEDQHFTAGGQRLIVEWKGWKFCPLVCYDLRFPVWSRNQNLEYDCLIYVANWPSARINAWDTLLKARAMENLCYTVGVNRVGHDGNEILFGGMSQILDFKGQELKNLKSAEDFCQIGIDKAELEKFRKKFPAHQDADNFQILS